MKTVERAFSNLKMEGSFYMRQPSVEAKKNADKINTANVLVFNADVAGKIKIGRLEPNCNFSILELAMDGKPTKIKAFDGREGILLGGTESYKIINPPLEKIIKFIVFTIIILVFFGAIGTVLANTGYIVILGILLIPIFYISKYLIGVPLYLLGNTIMKRL